MMKKLFILCFVASGLMLASCAYEDNPGNPCVVPTMEQTMLSILDTMERVNAYKEVDLDETGTIKSFVVDVKQFVDHNDANAGGFLQRLVIHLRDFDAPTVFYTNGYMNQFDQYSYLDLAEMIGANVVALEHRQFGTSYFEDPQWTYLTVEQSADDLHDVYDMLKPYLKGKWISTGTSKDGMTSIFYKTLHPEDMTVATSFCSPFNLSLTDMRVGTYMMEVSGTDAEKAQRTAVLRALTNDSIYEMYCNYLVETGQSVISPRDYISLGFEGFFGIHSYGDNSDREMVYPTLPLDSNYICKWLDWHGDYANQKAYEALKKAWQALNPGSRRAFNTEKLKEKDPEWGTMYAYSLQCAKQLGSYKHDVSVLKDLLPEGFDISDDNPCALNDEDIWLYKTYDNSLMLYVLDYLANTNDPILMVYSKNDPWTGARPEKTGPGIKTVINPIGVHSHDLFNKVHYDDASFNAIRDFVGQYFKIVNGTRESTVRMRALTASDMKL